MKVGKEVELLADSLAALSVGEMAGMMELLTAEKKAEAMVEQRAVL